MINKLNVVLKAIAIKKSNYPYVVSATLIILAILSSLLAKLSILANEALQSEAVGHVILIPFLISYLIHRKKEPLDDSLIYGRLL